MGKKMLNVWFCILLHAVNIATPVYGFYHVSNLSEESTYAHNKVRELHNIQDLVWDHELAKSAQEHSNYLSRHNSFEHSEGANNADFSENLYKGFDGFLEEKRISDAVFYWYLEIEGYDFLDPAPNLKLHGHFTALAWKESNQVGCGVTTNHIYGGLMTYITCHYRRTGNIKGKYIENIARPKVGAKIPEHPDDLIPPIGCWDTYERCNMWLGVCNQQVFKNIMLRYCKKSCKLC